MVLGGGLFLMSEVPLYAPPPRLCLSGDAERSHVQGLLEMNNTHRGPCS